MERDRGFAALIPIYLDALRAEGKSPRTVIAYAETLRGFMRHAAALDLPENVDEFSQTDVYKFLAAIRATGVCDATQHRRHREMKHFYSWLRRMDLVHESVFHRVPLIRLEQKVVRPFELEEVERLLQVREATTFLGARDAAMLLVLLDTGIRVSELTGLDVADIDIEAGRALVRNGKGRKQRVVAFGPRVGEALSLYMAYRGRHPGPAFETKEGVRMQTRRIEAICRRIGHRAGVEHVHPHRFRHTFATLAIRSAAREIDVQHLLGHTTSAMVRRYTRTYDAEQAASAHASFSPAAQLSQEHRPVGASTVMGPAVGAGRDKIGRIGPKRPQGAAGSVGRVGARGERAVR